MNNTNGMYSNYEVEQGAYKESCNMGYVGASSMSGMSTSPIYECPQERVIHREFVHEVPHICPINTKIVNHHIYKHTYSPCYTCCEENEICNIDQGCCNNF